MGTKPPAPASAESGRSTPEMFEATAKSMLEKALVLHSAHRSLSCDEIQQPVAKLCADARARGLQVETLIVELKQIWYAVPESASHDKAEVISCLVGMCIPEFYKTESPKPAK